LIIGLTGNRRHLEIKNCKNKRFVPLRPSAERPSAERPSAERPIALFLTWGWFPEGSWFQN